mgnify:CR=1|tara:strand:- start:43 stop:207 length:165 start_codon:yes stop_codon:yes gene_type:complete
MTYKLVKDLTGTVNQVRYTDSTNVVKIIPFIDGNTDYQAYLAWVAEGNTADPAD